MENEITITNDEARAMALALSEFLSDLMAYEGWGNLSDYDLELINRVLNPIDWECDYNAIVTPM